MVKWNPFPQVNSLGYDTLHVLTILSSMVHFKGKKKLIFIKKECEFCKFKLLSYILNLFALFYLEKEVTRFKKSFLPFAPHP